MTQRTSHRCQEKCCKCEWQCCLLKDHKGDSNIKKHYCSVHFLTGPRPTE